MLIDIKKIYDISNLDLLYSFLEFIDKNKDCVAIGEVHYQYSRLGNPFSADVRS